MNTSTEPNDPTSTPNTPHPALFWLTFAAAFGLYGLVILSPKLAHRELLLAESRNVLIEILVAEEKLNRYAEVARVIEREKRISTEFVGMQRTKQEVGEEVIRLEEPLPVELLMERSLPTTPRSIPKANWYAPVVILIARNSDIRGLLLLCSIVLILFAFGFLYFVPESKSHEPTIEQKGKIAKKTPPPPRQTIVSQWLKRYEKPKPPTEAELKEMMAKLLVESASSDWEEDTLPVDPFSERI